MIGPVVDFSKEILCYESIHSYLNFKQPLHPDLSVSAVCWSLFLRMMTSTVIVLYDWNTCPVNWRTGCKVVIGLLNRLCPVSSALIPIYFNETSLITSNIHRDDDRTTGTLRTRLKPLSNPKASYRIPAAFYLQIFLSPSASTSNSVRAARRLASSANIAADVTTNSSPATRFGRRRKGAASGRGSRFGYGYRSAYGPVFWFPLFFKKRKEISFFFKNNTSF